MQMNGIMRFDVFCCACYSYLVAYYTNKQLLRTIESVFLDYNMQHKGYMCMDLKTDKVYLSGNVRFNEDHFPFDDSIQKSPASLIGAFVPRLPLLTSSALLPATMPPPPPLAPSVSPPLPVPTPAPATTSPPPTTPAFPPGPFSQASSPYGYP